MLKMKKACINPDCTAYTEKIECSNLDKYCMRCASELKHVCSKKNCFNEVILDSDSLCEFHIKEKESKKQQRKDRTDKIIDKVGPKEAITAATTVAPVIVKVATDIVKK